MIVGAAGYTALVAASAFQAFHGLAPLDLSVPCALVLGASAALLAASYAIALRGIPNRFV